MKSNVKPSVIRLEGGLKAEGWRDIYRIEPLMGRGTSGENIHEGTTRRKRRANRVLGTDRDPGARIGVSVPANS